MEYVLSFKNTNLAIKTERYLLAENLGVTVMPLPPQIQAGCGICLRVKPEEISMAERIIHENKVEGTRLHTRDKTDNAYVYHEITKRGVLWNRD